MLKSISELLCLLIKTLACLLDVCCVIFTVIYEYLFSSKKLRVLIFFVVQFSMSLFRQIDQITILFFVELAVFFCVLSAERVLLYIKHQQKSTLFLKKIQKFFNFFWETKGSVFYPFLPQHLGTNHPLSPILFIYIKNEHFQNPFFFKNSQSNNNRFLSYTFNNIQLLFL